MRIQTLGENTVILLLSYDSNSKSVTAVRQLYQLLMDAEIPGILSARPGLDCLLVEFEDPDVPARLQERLKSFQPSSDAQRAPQVTEIPVCYEPEFGTDLDSVARQTGLSIEQIIHIHSSQVYQVWMIGFMPGFPYLGELPPELRLPRKSAPDPKLAAGSVAIAEEFVGVYPFDSPGGWHVLGRTPLQLTDYNRGNPFVFQYGMPIQFFPITKTEFNTIKKETESK